MPTILKKEPVACFNKREALSGVCETCGFRKCVNYGTRTRKEKETETEVEYIEA